MGRQGSVGPVMVGEADDARVVFRAAPLVAEVELFEAEDLRAGLAGEPVHGGAPDAAATHDDVFERLLSCSVHARPGSYVGLPSRAAFRGPTVRSYGAARSRTGLCPSSYATRVRRRTFCRAPLPSP